MALPRIFSAVFISLVLLFINGCGSGQPEIKVTPPTANQSLESYIESQNFSGTVYIAQDGEVLLNKAFGMADKATGRLNETSTRFRIGSLTKQFTAAAILTLQEQGLLNIEDPVSDYLSDFPRGDEITLKHLLTHTSGLPNYTELSAFEDTLDTNKTPVELMAMFKDLSLEFTPGQEFKYSNSGYVVLGVIIETLSGESYPDYMTNHIFTPMQMTNTGYGPNIPDDVLDAKGYNEGGGNAHYIDMSLAYAAGALVSNSEDLALWDNALYNNLLLSEASTDLLFTPNLSRYALGWQVTTVAGSDEMVQNHGGNIMGFTSFMIRFPESKKVIVILANINNYPASKLSFELNKLVEGS